MHIFCTTHLCISPVGAVEWNTVNNNSAVMTHEHCKIIQQELSSCWDGRPFGQNRRGRKVVAVVPLSVGELGPQLTQCRLSRGLPWSQVASWSIQPYGHNRQSWKLVGVVPLLGQLGPHLRQCGLYQGLLPYQVASWSIQPFGHNTPTSQTGQTDNDPIAKANLLTNGRPKTKTQNYVITHQTVT